MLKILFPILGTPKARRLTFIALFAVEIVAIALLTLEHGLVTGIAVLIMAGVELFVAAIVFAQLSVPMAAFSSRKRQGQHPDVVFGRFRGGGLNSQPDSAWDSLEMGEASSDPDPWGDQTQLEVFVAAMRIDIDQVKRELILLRRNEGSD